MKLEPEDAIGLALEYPAGMVMTALAFCPDCAVTVALELVKTTSAGAPDIVIPEYV